MDKQRAFQLLSQTWTWTAAFASLARVRFFSWHSRFTWASPLVAVAAITLLYACFWYPGPGGRVWFGDSVSFQFYAITHSLGHSPGYPQYLALIRTFARLPLGEAWQRVNLVSSLCAAAALCVYYRVGLEFGVPRMHALLATLTLATSKTFFCQATEAEVYALNSLWMFTCVGLFSYYLNTRDRRTLVALFVALGLGLGHHPTITLLGPPMLITVAVFDTKLLRDPRIYALGLMAIAIGAVQYIYTYQIFIDPHLAYRWAPLAQSTDTRAGGPILDFIDYSTGGPYKQLLLQQPLGVLFRDKIAQLLVLAHQQNVFVLPLLGVMGYATRVIPVQQTFFSSACFVTYGAWVVSYDVWDIEAFCTPIWAGCYLPVVAGAAAPLRKFMWPQNAERWACAAVLGLIAIGFSFSVVDAGFATPINRHLQIAEEYLAHVPPRAKFMPFTVEKNSALPSLFRYLEASRERGPLELVWSARTCMDGLYFTDGSTKYIRTREFGRRKLAHLTLSDQDLYVMECSPAAPREH